MVYARTQLGFTLTELLVVFAIITIIGTLSAVGFRNMYDASAIDVAHGEVYTALTDARSLTLGSSNGTVYGVRVSSTTVTRFTGSTYTEGAADNRTYTFEGGITATGTLVTTETDIVFKRLSGETTASGVVYLRNSDGNSTTTITLHGSGLVE